jgi:hypothetical protein
MGSVLEYTFVGYEYTSTTYLGTICKDEVHGSMLYIQYSRTPVGAFQMSLEAPVSCQLKLYLADIAL